MQSRLIQLIHIDEALFAEGWQFFQKSHDKTYSLTDCLSFIIMRQLDMDSALSFDKHFKQAGFMRLP
ncbi:MAG: type II toxin-antitoxin system VapC family toxin [Gammaproteobacteria bacterium]|nr:type II toxin-antitoxin system VapC family toxin [Gammaproteobacteria bacterium]